MRTRWRRGTHPASAREDGAPAQRRRLCAFLGIEWLGTRWWWISPVWMTGAGVAISLLTRPAPGVRKRVLIGLGYGQVIAASVLWHQVGTLVSGRVVGAPMDADLLTAILPVNLYRGDEGRTYPSRVHVGRALGGPLANLLLGVAMLILRARGVRRPVVALLAALNLLVAVASLVPAPTLDGGSIVRELRQWQPG